MPPIEPAGGPNTIGSSEPVVVTPRLLRDWPLPEPGSTKYARGQVLVVGGAARTPGAAQLSGLAALRVGAGQLRLAVAAPAAVPLAVATPEAAVLGLDADPTGSVLSDDIGTIADWLGSAGAVVLGPGLDNPQLTRDVVAAVLPLLGERTSLVLDAFALGALAELPALDDGLAARTVLTPNDGEAELLLGRPLGDDLANDVATLASRYQTVMACHDLVTTPDGNAWQLGIGHSGLATSGSGDVLAGALGGLLARGAEPAQAACWAKYLHAAAGERLASRIGRLGFLARELPEEFPSLLNELT
jgi:hydroxyethylthiazole kinase-like uncharacterized protein yjeF